MNLDEAVEQTGCAILFSGASGIISVEKLPEGKYLFMVRRGVILMECRFVEVEEIERRYPNATWNPARVVFVPPIPRRD